MWAAESAARNCFQLRIWGRKWREKGKVKEEVHASNEEKRETQSVSTRKLGILNANGESECVRTDWVHRLPSEPQPSLNQESHYNLESCRISYVRSVECFVEISTNGLIMFCLQPANHPFSLRPKPCFSPAVVIKKSHKTKKLYMQLLLNKWLLPARNLS